ncbi:MAG: DUF3099 domain-containing protein [Dermatophilaceae bacterium]
MRRKRSGQAPVVHTVTTAPVSVAMDQDLRMKRYLITMSIRTACFIAAFLAAGAMRWVFVVMAAALPYVAVVLANAVGPRWGSRITGFDRYADSGHVLEGTPQPTAPAVDDTDPPR